MVMGPRTSSVGVVLIDPPYDEIPADRTDNLYDEIHPRVSQLAGSTNQLDSGSSLDSMCTTIILIIIQWTMGVMLVMCIALLKSCFLSLFSYIA